MAARGAAIGGCSERGGDFYLATRGDLELATRGDFFMAMDTSGRVVEAHRLLQERLELEEVLGHSRVAAHKLRSSFFDIPSSSGHLAKLYGGSDEVLYRLGLGALSLGLGALPGGFGLGQPGHGPGEQTRCCSTGR